MTVLINRMVVFVFFVLCLVSAIDLKAQAIETKGTEFWFSILPNQHVNDPSKDSVYINIYSDVTTSGTLQYTTFSGKIVNKSFYISDVRRTTVIGIASSDIELRGSIKDTIFQQANQCEKVLTSQTIHCTAKNPVRLLVVNNTIGSSDGFSVLPNPCLGKYYIIPTQPNSIVFSTPNVNSQVNLNKSLPSQFSFTAIQDSTIVSYTLKNKSSSGTILKNVKLAKGETYFVQSNISVTDTLNSGDLSGSLIKSNKPIAVFSGNQQARVPVISRDKSQDSRNYLVEQITPMEMWGTHFVVPQFSTPANITKEGVDYIRIFPSDDNQSITINGNSKILGATGTFEDVPLNTHLEITSLSPLQVVAFKKSSTNQGQSTQNLSDASMVIIPSLEQYNTQHQINSFQVRDGNSKHIVDQFVTIIAPNSAVNSIVLDNAALTVPFTQIGTSGYSVVVRKVGDGLHTITADEPIGVLVYGYGNGDAYSYPSCMLLTKFPYLQTEVAIEDASVSVGDTFLLSGKLIHITYPPKVFNVTPKHFSYTVKVNATIFTPADPLARGEIIDGYQLLKYDGFISDVNIGDTLFSIPMICGLGDAEFSKVEVSNFTWYDNNDSLFSKLSCMPGDITINNVWHDTLGVRLVNPNSAEILLQIQPNPVVESAFITFKVPSSTFRLELFDALGNKTLDLTELAISERSKGFVTIQKSDFGSGMFFVRLSSEKFSVVRPLIAQ